MSAQWWRLRLDNDGVMVIDADDKIEVILIDRSCFEGVPMNKYDAIVEQILRGPNAFLNEEDDPWRK